MSIMLPRNARPLATLSAPPPQTAPPASRAGWHDVEIGEVSVHPCPDAPSRRVRLQTRVRLGALLPVDVTVDVVPLHGRPPGVRCRLFGVQPLAGGVYVFEGSTPIDELGRHGFEIRVSRVTRTGGAAVPPVVRRVPVPY